MEVLTTFTFKIDINGRTYSFNQTAPTEEAALKLLIEDLHQVLTEIEEQ